MAKEKEGEPVLESIKVVKSRKRQPRDPNAPKLPLSSFMEFCILERPENCFSLTKTNCHHGYPSHATKYHINLMNKK